MRVSALSAQVAALSTLGALLGVAMLVALGGAIFGPSPLGGQFPAAGRSVLTIMPGAAGPGRGAPLTTADVDAIARSVPNIAALSRAVFGTASVAPAADQSGQARIQGVDPSFAQVTSGTVAQGTFFTAQDASSANRVAVLGQTLSSQLFQNGQTPIGATIRIRGVPFTVIGVFAGALSDETVLIPFETGQVRLFGATALDAVLVQVTVANQTATVSQDVEQLLRQRHQVRAGQPDGFTIRTTSTTAPSNIFGQLVEVARQYACQAKGLCGSLPRYS